MRVWGGYVTVLYRYNNYCIKSLFKMLKYSLVDFKIDINLSGHLVVHYFENNKKTISINTSSRSLMVI